MAQDFYNMFGLGGDDKTISTIDPAGVALLAIQELNIKQKELIEKTAELEALKAITDSLKTDMELLKERLNALEK